MISIRKFLNGQSPGTEPAAEYPVSGFQASVAHLASVLLSEVEYQCRDDPTPFWSPSVRLSAKPGW
ncbi:MAG TPA: hypothetical protein VGH38_20055 [Bryobacteraceae bacterium]